MTSLSKSILESVKLQEASYPIHTDGQFLAIIKSFESKRWRVSIDKTTGYGGGWTTIYANGYEPNGWNDKMVVIDTDGSWEYRIRDRAVLKGATLWDLESNIVKITSSGN